MSDESVRVASVRDLGVIEDSVAVAMRDCGYSALFRGKSLWVFGDTILNTPNEQNQRMLSSSCAATWDLDAGDGLAGFEEPVDAVGAPRQFFPYTEEEREFNDQHRGVNCQVTPCGSRWAIWPGAIVVDQGKGLAYVFYHKVLVEPGKFNFTTVGHSISVLEGLEAQAHRPVFDVDGDYPTLMFSGPGGFASAAVVAGDTVYVYGCELREELYVKPCRMGRVPLEQILQPNAWRFYAGGNWLQDYRKATDLFDGNDMMSVFYNSYLDKYLAIYSKPLEAVTLMRWAQHPSGPWSMPLELFANEAPVNDFGWVYDALAHPELEQDNGRIIYVSYSRQTGPGRSEMRLVSIEFQ